MRRSLMLLSAGITALSSGIASAQSTPHNVILFVPDGLRGGIVSPQTAPTMAEIRDKGVNFKNSHSLFPTFTTANASAMSTGHYLGDTGDFSNTIYTGYPLASAAGTVTPFLESDPVLHDVDEHFGGDYLNEETVLKMARGKGYSTAAIGKLGPDLDLRSYRQDRHRRPAFDRDRRLHRVEERRAAVGRDEGRAGARPTSRWKRPRAATTARPAIPRPPAPPCRTPRSRPISPTSPPRWCCRCSRPATSRS